MRGRGAWWAAWALVVAFLGWTAVSDNVSWRFGAEQADYYNLLVDGFLDGQLSLKAEVPPELLAAADPYDPAQRPAGVALHDASLYRGKYYIYYGVVPAALVLLPFRVAAGVDLPLPAAVLALTVAGFSGALLLLAAMWRAYFPRVNAWAAAGIGAAMGVCSCVVLLVRRGSMYDLPIASGFCWAMAALWLLWRAVHAERRTAAWLAASAAAWGLAIGSRPTYLLAPAGLLLAALALGRGRARWRNAVAVFAPLVAIGLALAWYNYARFGSATEFGLSYILSGVYEARIEHFRPRYATWNLTAYFTAGSDWSAQFPFFVGREIARARPAQHFGMDIPFGLLPHVPFLLLALAAPLALTRCEAEERVRRRSMLLALAVAALAPLALLVMFYAAMVRYTGDFAPTLALLAAVGALAAIDRWGRRMAAAVAALAVFSVTVVALFSVRAYDRVRAFNPRTYERLERIAEAPLRALGLAPRQRAPSRALAPEARVIPNLADGIRLRVTFSADGERRREPLLVSGEKGRGNALVVERLEAGRVRFVFEHWGRRSYLGPEIAIEPGRDYELVVRHPLYSRAGAAAVPVGRDALVLELDGVRVWDVTPLFYPPRAGELWLGVDPLGFDDLRGRFGGRLGVSEALR